MIVWLLFPACAPPDGTGPGVTPPDTGTPDTPVEPAAFSFGDPVACASPAESPSWTDVAQSRGLIGTLSEEHTAGGTAVVADLDGDGDLDIAATYPDETRFYVREGPGYRMQVVGAAPNVALLTAGDLDGDGLPEVLRGGGPPAILALRDGAVVERYVVDTPEGEPKPRAQGVYPHDIDGDGAVDLYAMQAAPEDEDFVFRGGTDGYVADLDALPAGTRGGKGFDARWFDWDGDRDLDLYVVNDQGPDFGPNVLYENDGGVLVDASERCACALSTSAMGVDVGDYDADGLPDLYVTISANEALLRGSADGMYVDTTVATGIPRLGAEEMGWGAVFLDLENDGDLDIYEARGDLWNAEDPIERRYDTTPRLLVQADGQFSEQAAAWELAPLGSWRTVVPFDDNGDGVLDLLVTDVVGTPSLFMSDGCTAAGWLDVAAPVGARVEVTAGGRTQTAWVTMQSGMGGSRPPVAHFGLGDVDTVEQLRVTLPDGSEHHCDEPFAARRRVTVGSAAGTE